MRFRNLGALVRFKALLLLCWGTWPLFATSRTVIHNETGLIFTVPAVPWNSVGAAVSHPYDVNDFSQMDPNALKVFHTVFSHASVLDDHESYFFPYTDLLAYQTDEVNAGRQPFYITAMYAGQDRPVYFGSTQHRAQAINAGDDRYVRFFANEVARKIMLSPNYPNTVIIPNYPNSWIGIDGATFEYSAYSVLNNSGNPVSSPTWDPPFPQNDSQLLAGIEQFAAALKQIAPDVHLMYNEGSIADSSQFSAVYANVDGMMRENIVAFANGNYAAGNLYQIYQNIEWILSNGKVALLRQPVDGTAAQIETAAISYLIVKDGNSFFSEINLSGGEINPSQYMPIFYALGSPTGPEQDGGEVNANNPGNRLYWRSFEGGMVYLNWTGATQNVTLPSGQTYYDQNGNAVSQLTLPDQTGTYVTTLAGTRVAYPSISPPSGTMPVSGPITVTITDATPGAQIYYTLDGTIPTAASTPYTGPFSLSQTATVTAIASLNGELNSFEDTANFNVTATEPNANFVVPNDSGTPFFSTTYAAIALDQAPASQVTLNYSVSNLNATGSGLTFSPSTGSVTFGPGETVKAVPIQIYLSPAENAVEALQVTLTGGTNVNLGSNITYTYTVTANSTTNSLRFANLHPVASGGLSAANPDTACQCATVDTGTATAGYNERSLFRFDLTSLPSNAAAQNAAIFGYLPYSVDSSGSGVLSASVYRMLNSWTDGQATWNNSGGVAANFASSPSSTSNALNGARWDVTADTQAFLTGAASNQGWLFIGEENAAGAEIFRLFTNHSSVLGLQPSLYVTYSVPGVPQAVLSASSLSFENQNVGTTSPTQNITVMNGGTAPMSITNISITGSNWSDFAQTNTCSSSLAVGANCSISVSFSPSLGSAESATLNIADNVAGSPQTVPLSGTGVTTPQASLSAATVAFGNQNLATTSAAQTITLSNSGTGALSITSIAITGTNPGDFNQTNNCGTSVAATANCTISITFTPQAVGSRSATLTVTDSVAGSPQSVGLSGTGVGVPQASLSAPSVAFGNQNLGTTSAAQTITLSNPGTGALSITSIAITGTNSGDFGQTNNCGTSVAATANCTILITFTPQAVGSRSATLTVTDSVTGSPQSVGLSGTGVGVPQVSLDPPNIAFGNQNLGTTSSAQTITLSNPGTGALSITSIAITGTNPGDFGETNNCGSSVASGGYCNISVTFSPQAVGARSASVTVTQNATGSPLTAGLAGTGVGVPKASSSGSKLSFGNQDLGTTSAAQTITLSNPGTGALSITSIAINGTNPTDFSETNNCGTSLAPATGCTISVTFSPQAAGLRSASLTISDNAAGSPQSASLTGTGVAVPQISLSASSIGFGDQNVGTTSTAQPIKLSNPGTATLSVTSIAVTGTNASDFKETNTCGTAVKAGSNCSISVTFSPQAVGSRSASVTITDNAAGSPHTVGLSGTGVGVPKAALSPSTVSFGNQPVGSTSGSTKIITLSNPGTASLAITSIALSGADGADFEFNTNCGTTLAPGASCTSSLLFKPKTAGLLTASVSVKDNAAGSPQTVAVSGTGVAVPAITLSPSSIAFGNQKIKTTSTAHSITVSNPGSGTLSISKIAITGTNSADFKETSTCGATLAVQASCSISVSFSPRATGARSASVTITDNAFGSPQTVGLSGSGTN